MATDKIKRAFVWIRRAMRITEKTTLPGEINGQISPTLDLFGWERFNPSPVGDGVGPQDLNAQGTLAVDLVVLAAVPAGIMRYVFRASMSSNDPANPSLSMQIRNGAIDIGIGEVAAGAAPNPARHGGPVPFLLAPGEQLICRSVPAPAAATRLFIRYRFVDIDFGEYIPPL